MQQVKGRRIKIMMMFFVCVATCSFVGCDDSAVPDRNVFSTAAEQTRVTSPDGRLDAVLVRDPYGPAAGGGVDWDVYIVTKGSPIRMKTAHELFRADPLTGGHLVWKENHLLEIHYDIAQIHEFRNLWGLHEVENVGSQGEHDYLVEIRLVPSSDFSFLTPDGLFKSRD
jgi:hypothetical protein